MGLAEPNEAQIALVSLTIVAPVEMRRVGVARGLSDGRVDRETAAEREVLAGDLECLARPFFDMPLRTPVIPEARERLQTLFAGEFLRIFSPLLTGRREDSLAPASARVRAALA